MTEIREKFPYLCSLIWTNHCSKTSTLRDRCEGSHCWNECRPYYGYNCDICVDTCLEDIKSTCAIEPDNYECIYITYKLGMVISCTMFFISAAIGIFVLVLFTKLPRDPCCYPNYGTPLQRNQLQFRVTPVKVKNSVYRYR